MSREVDRDLLCKHKGPTVTPTDDDFTIERSEKEEEEGGQLAAAWMENTPEEKKLLRKIDVWLMTTIWVLYMVSYMDRSNIAIISFFLSYVVFEVPSNMILARSRPSLYISFLVIFWETAASLSALVQTPTQLIMARFVLGLAEAGFSPGFICIISTWYRKSEHSKRYLAYLSAGILSGSFGGIVAGAITKGLDGAHGIAVWRWLFIVEGVATVSVGLMAPFFLLDYPASCKKFTEEERRLACSRLAADHVTSHGIGPPISHGRALLLCGKSWRVRILSLAFMSVLGPFSFSYFYPTLVKGLGYTAVNAQFMTAPIYFVAFMVAIPVCWFVDRHPSWRGMAACIILLGGALFSALSAGVLDCTARYVFLCFITASAWTAAPVVMGYAADIFSRVEPHTRAVALAFINTWGNFAQLYGAILFPSNDAPRYLTGFVTWSALMLWGAVLYCTSWFLFRKYPVRNTNM